MTPVALFILGILAGLIVGAIGMLIVNHNREKDLEGWVKTYRAYQIECEEKNVIHAELHRNYIRMLELAWKVSHQLISVLKVIRPELEKTNVDLYWFDKSIADPVGCHERLNEILHMPDGDDDFLLDKHGEEHEVVEKKVEACKLKVDTLKEAYEKTYGEPYSCEENIK